MHVFRVLIKMKLTRGNEKINDKKVTKYYLNEDSQPTIKKISGILTRCTNTGYTVAVNKLS